MKKRLIHFLTWTLLLASASCSDEAAMVESPQPAETQISSNIRTADEVLSIAANAAKMKSSNSRAGEIKVNPKSLFAINDNDSRANDSDPLLFAVDFEDNEGFAIIAADKRVSPILFIADNGGFISDETRRNENFQFFIDKAKDYVKAETSFIVKPTLPSDSFQLSFRYDTLYVGATIMSPRLKVEWNQGWPENIYCPNHIAGCGPIAMAQTLSFVEKPTSITLTFPERDQNSQILDWTDIKKHKSSDGRLYPDNSYFETHSKQCRANDSTHKAIARLVRQIGQDANAQYEANGTGTYFYVMAEVATKYLSSSNVVIYNSSSFLYDALNNKQAVAYMRGTDKNAGGHAWVADAARQNTLKINYYEYDVLQWSKVETVRYIHHNWGWGGSCNGFALDGVFDTTKTNSKKPGGQYDFSSGVRFFTVSK